MNFNQNKKPGRDLMSLLYRDSCICLLYLISEPLLNSKYLDNILKLVE